MQPDNVFGWDIGGAHIKVAVASSADRITQVQQLPCPLWLGVDQLHAVIKTLQDMFDFSKAAHAITMTAELVDHFKSREEGVLTLVKTLPHHLKTTNISYFAGPRGLVNAVDATHLHADIASANWLASANYIATHMRDALFIDIGSTTSDVMVIKDHGVKVAGYTDAQRLYAQELVYCGVVRTPVFALCKAAPVAGKFIPIINEYFANAADVYRLTQELPGYADMSDTLDGRDKDAAYSAMRLARMFGHDATSEELARWRVVAEYVREQQLQVVINACRKQLSMTPLALNAPIVGAGVGRFLVKEIALRLNCPYIDFDRLLGHENSENALSTGDCAPAVAVACLGFQKFCP